MKTLVYNTELLIISKLNLLGTVRFPNSGIIQESEEFPTITGIAIRGPTTTESRTGSLETSAAGFSLLALHGTRGSKTTDHTSLRGLRQMENICNRQTMSRPTSPAHFTLLWGTALQLRFLTLKYIHLQKASVCLSVLSAFARVPMTPINKSGFKYIIHLNISQNHLTHIRFLSFLCIQSFFSVCNKFHPRRYHIPTWKHALSIAPTKFMLLQTVWGRGNAVRGNQGMSISLMRG